MKTQDNCSQCSQQGSFSTTPPHPMAILLAFTELILFPRRAPQLLLGQPLGSFKGSQSPHPDPLRSAHCFHLAASSPSQKLQNHNGLLLFRFIFPWLWKNISETPLKKLKTVKNGDKKALKSLYNIIKMCTFGKESIPLCKQCFIHGIWRGIWFCFLSPKMKNKDLHFKKERERKPEGKEKMLSLDYLQGDRAAPT